MLPWQITLGYVMYEAAGEDGHSQIMGDDIGKSSRKL
jgi:hypothetical protein